MVLLLDYYKFMISLKTSHLPDICYGTASIGILRQHHLEKLLNARISRINKNVAGIIGWGAKPNTIEARKYAQRNGLPFLALEDGFLRSYGVGDLFPTLSLIVDNIGIYYDSTRPSALEQLLNSQDNFPNKNCDKIKKAKELIVKNNLSKYNHAPDDNLSLRNNEKARVLVIDQTFGDMGVKLAAADSNTFSLMLESALDENPSADIYIKTHPETTSGQKLGYLSNIRTRDKRIKKISHLCNPLSLMKKIDHIYVVSSTMGFEALLLDKKVTCFGIPWYSGWGVTDDRAKTSRRIRSRSVDELFYAAYFEYTKYINPKNHKVGDIFDVIEWLILQKKIANSFSKNQQNYS